MLCSSSRSFGFKINSIIIIKKIFLVWIEWERIKNGRFLFCCVVNLIKIVYFKMIVGRNNENYRWTSVPFTFHCLADRSVSIRHSLTRILAWTIPVFKSSIFLKDSLHKFLWRLRTSFQSFRWASTSRICGTYIASHFLNQRQQLTVFRQSRRIVCYRRGNRIDRCQRCRNIGWHSGRGYGQCGRRR